MGQEEEIVLSSAGQTYSHITGRGWSQGRALQGCRYSTLSVGRCVVVCWRFTGAGLEPGWSRAGSGLEPDWSRTKNNGQLEGGGEGWGSESEIQNLTVLMTRVSAGHWLGPRPLSLDITVGDIHADGRTPNGPLETLTERTVFAAPTCGRNYSHSSRSAAQAQAVQAQ